MGRAVHAAGAWQPWGPTFLSLWSHPSLAPQAALESGAFWNSGQASRYSEPIAKFLRVSGHLSGTQRVLINYDLRGFDVPGVKKGIRGPRLFSGPLII